MSFNTPTERQKLNMAKERLWHACKKWVDEHKLSCPEAIYQSDEIQGALPELAEIVCENVGFTEDQ
jgi:hypothetical protein